jgi:GT2 family glycosyltransferase
MSADIAAIHSSHSWRVTAPLRRASGFARRLLARDARPLAVYGPAGSTAGGHVLPAMGTCGDDAAPAPAAAPRAEAAEPAFERRQHPGLATFLTDEFGATAAQEVLRRIDRYRLPVDVDKVRIADQTRCSLGDAMAWAAAIAATAVPRTDDPDVSIIIPVYNQLPFTLACIDALLAHRTRYSFEILIGDDASTDATPDAFRAPIAGVRHIRHPSNLGFVRNCNATAAHARGRYVVLLNNDTQVLPGWLDELIDTLDDERIGLAGSKLVFPDGRLQECGGIVWRDGSAWNYGRMDDPRRPEYCYLRDTDYVSGAALALRRADWEEMGGFDEWYVPAYAEDVDLAFRMRARGLRTVVQPLSQLLHFEGVSSGTDLAHGAKAYQVENLRKLHQRWHAVLQDHRDNADRPDLEKERNVARRLLFVDMVTPTPNEDAGSLVAFEMMDAFRANGCKITFIPSDNFAHMGEGTRALQRKGIEAIYHPAHASMASFLASRDDAYDIIVLVRFAVGEAHLSRLRQKYPLARIIFSNCDLHYLREMREAELSGDPLAIAAAHETKRREIDVIARSDVNLVHSQAELELLEKDVPGAPCVLFPLVHDPVEHRVPLALRDGICFVGGYRHAPNADGIVWFVENIWPLVLAAAPGHTLYIAGSSMTADVRALAAHSNVQVVGFVEDLDGFLAKRRATIAPLRFGAGAKGKVAVSLANGVPVVSTSIGSEGMQMTPGVDVLVADSIVDFAAAVVDVLGDDALWQRLSDAGLAYAQRVTSRRSAHQRISDILAKIGL